MVAHNIDHRLHETDFADDAHAPLYPSLGISIEALEAQDAVLLIGANIQREQPLAAHRLRKATLRGAKVSSVNVVDYQSNFDQAEKIIVGPNQLVSRSAARSDALVAFLKERYKKLLPLLLPRCLYAGTIVFKKRRAFSSKPGCDSDCGCSGASKKLPS